MEMAIGIIDAIYKDREARYEELVRPVHCSPPSQGKFLQQLLRRDYNGKPVLISEMEANDERLIVVNRRRSQSLTLFFQSAEAGKKSWAALVLVTGGTVFLDLRKVWQFARVPVQPNLSRYISICAS